MALAWDPSVTDYSLLSMFSPSITTTMTPASETTIYVVGVDIAVMWESKDLPLLSQATIGTGFVASSPGATTASEPATTTTSVTSGQSNSLGNPGIIAAIAIGAFVAGVLLVGGAILCRRARRKHALQAEETGLHPNVVERKAELDSRVVRPVAELEHRRPNAASLPAAELDGHPSF